MQDFFTWSNKRKEKIIRYISKYINVLKFLGITLVFFQLLVQQFQELHHQEMLQVEL